ncbi:MAG: hypothetical protein H6Q99_308 [Proteobacteria bacterium]|nr:hypothetical protein [Pseudomonadota bacterium]
MAKHTKQALNMLMPVLELVDGIERKSSRTILSWAYDYVVSRRWKVGVDTLHHYCTSGTFNLTDPERMIVSSRPILSAVLDVAMALKPFEDGSYQAAREPVPAPAEPHPDPFKPGFKKLKAGRKLGLGPRTPPPVAKTRKK